MQDRYHPGYRDPRHAPPRDYDRNLYDGYRERDRPQYYPRQYDSMRRSPSPRYDRRDGRGHNERYDDGYTFRGAAAARDEYRPQHPRETFSFRAPSGPGPRFPSPPRGAQQPSRPPPRGADARRCHGQRAPPGRGDAGTHNRRGRGGYKPRSAHSRDILSRVRRGGTPEQLEGMNADGHAHFLALDSNSEAEDEDEDYIGLAEKDVDGEDASQGRSKRVKTTAAPPEPEVPKWSNPDPYTSLPPPDHLGGPKKDIVQSIRKAKIEAAAKTAPHKAVADNEDFISFSFDGIGSEEGEVDDVDDGGSDDVSVSVSPPRHAPAAPAAMRSRGQQDANTNFTSHANGNFFSHLATQRPTMPPPSEMAYQQGQVRGSTPPPPPPADLIMPTDEEIAAQLAAQYLGPNGQGQGKKRKHGQQSRAVGDVLPEWQPNESNPTPWCIEDHTRTDNAGLRLHKEICDFLAFVQPYDYEEAVRQGLIGRIEQAVRRMRNSPGAKDAEIKCFGSFAAGLYLPTADMDLVAVTPAYLHSGMKQFCQSNSKIHKLAQYLDITGIAAPGTTSAVTKAKVPIVKFVDRMSGIRVDISFENTTGLVANQTFQQWKAQYPAMPAIVVMIKQLLAMRGLNEVFTGGLGGFSIICLVVSMMQLMPEIQSGSMDPTLHYNDLLMTFLDLYGNKFQVERTGITMNPPGYFDKIAHPFPKQNPNGLTIIDPNKPDNDISGGSRSVNNIFALFRSAHADIQRRLDRISSGQEVEGSILGCILGGNYSSFLHQRNKLSVLHRGHAVSPPPPPPPPQQQMRPKAVPRKRLNGASNGFTAPAPPPPPQSPPPPSPPSGPPPALSGFPLGLHSHYTPQLTNATSMYPRQLGSASTGLHGPGNGGFTPVNSAAPLQQQSKKRKKENDSGGATAEPTLSKKARKKQRKREREERAKANQAQQRESSPQSRGWSPQSEASSSESQESSPPPPTRRVTRSMKGNGRKAPAAPAVQPAAKKSAKKRGRPQDVQDKQRDRAQRFKAEFPNATGIPATMSKAAAKRLRANLTRKSVTAA